MIHDKAYNRAKTFTKAKRKYRIDRDKAAGRWSPCYDNLHQYADNKIHSTSADKTNNKGRHICGSPMNWEIKDKKKLEEMDDQMEELDGNISYVSPMGD